MRIRFKIFASLIAVAVLFAMAICARAAESECKGLEQQACEGNDRCSWVRGYTTSKGTEVSAFCRRKPGRKKSSQISDTPEES